MRTYNNIPAIKLIRVVDIYVDCPACYHGESLINGASKMIDEYWTWKFYGYCSDELKPRSNKPIVARCDGCCKYRISSPYAYRDLCPGCSHKGLKHPPRTPEYGIKMSKLLKDKKKPPRTTEHCKRISAGQQGIPYEDWTGFTTENLYCEKFDDACRERIRLKYGHRCYICDKPHDENVSKNGNVRRLSVHHIDRNRNQGCDGVLWKLVPLCMHCHPGAHKDPLKSRIEYLVNDEEPTENLQ